jgi:hypothetical protein
MEGNRSGEYRAPAIEYAAADRLWVCRAIGVWLTELLRQRSSQPFHNFLRLFTAV